MEVIGNDITLTHSINEAAALVFHSLSCVFNPSHVDLIGAHDQFPNTALFTVLHLMSPADAATAAQVSSA